MRIPLNLASLNHLIDEVETYQPKEHAVKFILFSNNSYEVHLDS